MVDFVGLTCPSCGGKLEIKASVQRFACGYCGTEFIVERSGGIVSLEPVVEELKGVKAGVDKTASELAIKRLEAEISELSQQRASIGKNSQGCFLLLLAGTVIFLCGTLFSFTDEEFGDPVQLVVVTIAFALCTVIVYIFEVKENEKKVRAINQKILEKEQELEKHRSIVKN